MDEKQPVNEFSWNNLLSPGSVLPQPVPGPPPGGPRWAALTPLPDTRVEELVQELVRRPPEGGAVARFVRGDHCTTTEQFFRECERALGLPDYFGYNWDSFEECFGDMLVLDHGGVGAEYGGRNGEPAVIILVVVTHSEELLRLEPHTEFQTLVSVLRRAALGHGWPEGGHRHSLAALRVFFQHEPSETQSVQKRFENTELERSKEELA